MTAPTDQFVDIAHRSQEAVTTVAAPTAEADGRVVGVIAHGYRIGDEVLRPALRHGLALLAGEETRHLQT